MKEQLIEFETAILTKEKGFEIEINSYYDGNPDDLRIGFPHKNNMMQRFRYSAPTQSLLQRWLREEYFIDVFVIDSIKENCYDWEIRQEDQKKIECDQYYYNYEAALEDGLIKALKLL